MLELRLVGVHDDGENLVLESADGTRFVLPIDVNLRTSITKARRIQPARGLGSKGSFGPRDIQTRFRQGASVEEIAEESGWEPERVRRYEWPIVAERAHIIRAAQGVKVGRRSSASGLAQIPVTLASRIADVTEAHGFADATQDWSTRQKENGQWSIEVDFALTPSDRQRLPAKVMFPARWVYNPANQSLYASNEAAYFLMGNTLDEVFNPDSKQQDKQPAPAVDPATSVADVPVAVTTGVAAVAEESKSNTSALKGTSPDERKLNELLERARSISNTAPTTQELRVVAQPPYPPAEDEEPENTSGSPTQQGTAEDVDENEIPSFAVGASAQPAVASDPYERAGSSEHHSVEAPQRTPGTNDEPEPGHVQNVPEVKKPQKPKPAGKKGRMSVPAWDEIIFGGRK